MDPSPSSTKAELWLSKVCGSECRKEGLYSSWRRLTAGHGLGYEWNTNPRAGEVTPPPTPRRQSELPLRALSPLPFPAQHVTGFFHLTLPTSLTLAPQRVKMQVRGTGLAPNHKECMCWHCRHAVARVHLKFFCVQLKP